MRIVEISRTQVHEHPALEPFASAATGCTHSFLWISVQRDELQVVLPQLQDTLYALSGTRLVDLHVSDLLNEQLPSHFDYTSDYELLVFRRLASGTSPASQPGQSSPPHQPSDEGLPMLRRIDTRPVGFALFKHVLLTIHPGDSTVRDAVAAKLGAATAPSAAPALDVRATSARLPASPTDLMLRVVSEIVDGYLDLRRELTRQLDHWQNKLIDPRSHFGNWKLLMQARQALRQLHDICEDQHGAIQDWMDAFETLPPPTEPKAAHEHELVMVRGRDVLEHIERVIRHVRRIESNAETAVQMHFNIQSHRTNDIMRMLTVITAVFLPLNLIAGIFGMNFESIPLLHKADGFWIALGAMGAIALGLTLVFWRKRYLARVSK